MDRPTIRAELPGWVLIVAAVVTIVGALSIDRVAEPATTTSTTAAPAPVAAVTDESLRALAAALLAYADAVNGNGGAVTPDGRAAAGTAGEILNDARSGDLDVQREEPPTTTTTATTAPAATTTTTVRSGPDLQWVEPTVSTLLEVMP